MRSTALGRWGWRCSASTSLKWFVCESRLPGISLTTCCRQILGTPRVRIQWHGGKKWWLFLWQTFKPLLEWRSHHLNIMYHIMPACKKTPKRLNNNSTMFRKFGYNHKSRPTTYFCWVIQLSQTWTTATTIIIPDFYHRLTRVANCYLTTSIILW